VTKTNNIDAVAPHVSHPLSGICPAVARTRRELGFSGLRARPRRMVLMLCSAETAASKTVSSGSSQSRDAGTASNDVEFVVGYSAAFGRRLTAGAKVSV
jgi:hypothetical protein